MAERQEWVVSRLLVFTCIQGSYLPRDAYYAVLTLNPIRTQLLVLAIWMAMAGFVI